MNQERVFKVLLGPRLRKGNILADKKPVRFQGCN